MVTIFESLIYTYKIIPYKFNIHFNYFTYKVLKKITSTLLNNIKAQAYRVERARKIVNGRRG